MPFLQINLKQDLLTCVCCHGTRVELLPSLESGLVVALDEGDMVWSQEIVSWTIREELSKWHVGTWGAPRHLDCSVS